MEHLAQLESQAIKARSDFLTTELSLCFTLIRLAETEDYFGDHHQVEQLIADAEHGYATLQRFADDPLFFRVSQDAHNQLMAEISGLRKKLDAFQDRLAGAGREKPGPQN